VLLLLESQVAVHKLKHPFDGLTINGIVVGIVKYYINLIFIFY